MVLKLREVTDIFLATIDNFIKFGRTVPLKNKDTQTTKDSFEKLLITSKRKSKLFETDRGKEFYNILSQ